MWNSDLTIDPSVVEHAAVTVRRSIELGLPAFFTATGLLLLPSTTRCEVIRLVQLAKRTAAQETPTVMSVFPVSDKGDLVALLFSETLSNRLAGNSDWGSKLRELSEASLKLIQPVLQAMALSTAGDPYFVFDMQAVAVQSIASVAGAERHYSAMVTSHLNGMEPGENAEVIMLLSPSLLPAPTVKLAEAA